MIFGNLYLDEEQSESACVGPFDFSSCDADRGWMVPILIAVFMMVTYVLLVNLFV